METAVFLLFAALAVGSAIVVIAHKSPVYSTLSLVLTLFSVAVLFVLLGAPFIAVLQILIYAGAILVLFLFVIMLLNVGREEGLAGGHQAQLVTALVAAGVFCGILALLLWRSGGGRPAPLTEAAVALPALAWELFHDYLLPFEIVGLLLLVAVIGATVVARRPALGPASPAAEAGAAEAQGAAHGEPGGGSYGTPRTAPAGEGRA
ncbi:MAG TPA: NADH-quinone oxidoreductase subunit J [Thermoanaerobaculia bacterium]|nr:NADH-quinone oxidoreductase subunit J [Thermoanaerobaculia bacterium]